MKKFAILAAVLLISLFLPAIASAISQEEWDQKSRVKTSGTATLYAIERNPDATDTALAVQLIETGSLASGIYVYPNEFDYDLNMWQIAYLENGSEALARVKKSELVDAYTRIYFDDGSIDDVPEALAKDTDALLLLLKKQFPDRTYSTIPGSSNIHVEYSRPSETTPPVKDPNRDIPIKGKGGPLGEGQKNGPSAKYKENVEVTVDELGTYICKVSYLDKTEEFLTSDLNFGTDVPEDKKLAVIYTPRTGKASLRRSASGRAGALKQCKAGTLVIVLEYGMAYSLINYKNTAGYILTECLKFHGATEGIECKGMLGYKGKVSGGTTVNILLEADGGSRKIGEFRTGTEVAIINYGDEWCEIEVGGLRGFVMTEFLVKS